MTEETKRFLSFLFVFPLAFVLLPLARGFSGRVRIPKKTTAKWLKKKTLEKPPVAGSIVPFCQTRVF